MNTFEKSQSAKILSCYANTEEDIEKAAAVGTINAHGKQKQADGSWKYVGKKKTDAVEEHFENKRKNLHEAHSKEINAHYEKMNTDSLHHQKAYNDASRNNKSNEELRKLADAHTESHIKNQEDLKALHNKHDSERSALIKEYSEARKKGPKPASTTDYSKVSDSELNKLYDTHVTSNSGFGRKMTDTGQAIHKELLKREKDPKSKFYLGDDNTTPKAKADKKTTGEDSNDNRFVDAPLDEVRRAALTDVNTPNARVAEQELIRRAHKITGKPVKSLSSAIDILDKNK